jgi:hypothetical protein
MLTEAQRQKNRERARLWREANPERAAEIGRAYRKRNQGAVNARKRRWEQQNAEHFLAHRAEYDRKYYEANGAKKREAAKDARANDPAKHLLHGARVRAKRGGYPCTIELADIYIPDVCPVLGIPLRRNTGRIGPGENSPTLDKIIPELGYVPGNIAVISHRANSIKRDATIDEVRRVLRWLEVAGSMRASA